MELRNEGSSGGSGSSITLETNGVLNGDQSLLNLVQGTGITITDDGFGNITFDSSGSGLAIGDPVGGGNPNDVLFIDGSGNFAQDDAFFFTSGVLNVQILNTKNDTPSTFYASNGTTILYQTSGNTGQAHTYGSISTAFVSHVDYSSITADRSFNFPDQDGTIVATSNPGMDTIYVWDSTDSLPVNAVIGTGLTYDHATHTLNASGTAGVSSVTGTSPIIVDNTDPANPIVTIQVANTSQDGYLTSTDWNTFNDKQETITLTTTGSSGVATFIAGTLNIPNYVTDPGGLNTQLQYNNSGVFGGITGAVTDGTSVSLTAPHLLNPTINGAGVGLATLAYPNTASNATITFPIVTGTLATLAGTEALTNKSVNGVTLTTGGTTTTFLNAAGAYTTPVGTIYTGTSNRITVTGTVIDIAATYVGQTSITTLGTITTGVWNGTAIANANLANSSITIGSTNIALGATSTTLAGLTSVTSTTFVGALTGNASTATALQNARTIGGVSFDGTTNITVATATGGFTISGGTLTLSTQNLVTDTSTGTKIGTATNQKLGFFNSTPIVQPTGDVITALQNLGLGASLTVAATTITSRTLWGQTYDGSGNVTGSLTAVGNITGGASSMTILAGTGASRTLTFQTTTSGSAATTALTLNADQTATFASSVTATAIIPSGSTVPSNGMYLPAANTLAWAINSAIEVQLTGTALSPGADGGSSLGTTALGWQNLFGNTGFVFNIEGGDWVATHTTGVLNIGTGTLKLANPTNNTTSVLTTDATQTLTSKRITKRTGTVASSTTPTINSDTVDFYSITALAAAITSFTTNLSGTPTEGQTLWIAITDNGTARALAWGAKFEASGNLVLPTTTVISTRLDVGFVWNTVTSAWRCVAAS